MVAKFKNWIYDKEAIALQISNKFNAKENNYSRSLAP